MIPVTAKLRSGDQENQKVEGTNYSPAVPASLQESQACREESPNRTC